MKTTQSCPCCSSIPYQNCCAPFHLGKVAANALQLMRSRYSAYALDIPDYIIATTHPENLAYSKNTVNWRRQISKFSRMTSFQNLSILEFQDGESRAHVTFRATLMQELHDTSFTEKSEFEKVNGRWLYLSGQIE